MRILVSNDDGIHSPGLTALATAAREFGDVLVVAPDVERSSSGHAITASHPLTYRATTVADLTAFRVNGTPADCVALGMHRWDHVDVVLSGLNLGLNLGHAVWHSGTLAAAKQAALLGVRGIAISAPTALERDFTPVLPWLRRCCRRSSSTRPASRWSTSTCRASRAACCGPAPRRRATTAASCPAAIRWAGRSTGSRSCRSRRPKTSRIAGRWSSGGCR